MSEVRKKGSPKPAGEKVFFSKDRLGAITDSIVTISMTLLVIGINVPNDIPLHPTDQEIFRAVRGLLPQFLSYVVSFFILGSIWVGHAHQHEYLRRVDGGNLWITLLWLLFVVLVPFTATLVGDYPEHLASTLLFHTNMFLIGVFSTLYWTHSVHAGNLDVEKLPRRMIVRMTLLALLLPSIAGLAIVVTTLAKPEASLWIYLLFPIATYKLKQWVDPGISLPLPLPLEWLAGRRETERRESEDEKKDGSP